MSKLDARIKINVKSVEQLLERWGPSLAARGLFIRHDRPPAVDGRVQIQFRLPDGTVHATVEARIVHSRPATTPKEPTAGMGLQIETLDAAAEKLVSDFKASGAKGQVAMDAPQEGIRVESIGAGEDVKAGAVLGIDLGTTFCCVAIARGEEPEVLTDDGHETIPSLIFVSPQKQVIVGHKAQEKMVLDPARGIYGSKRFIGRPFGSREVGTYAHFFNYTLAPGKTGLTAAKIGKMTVPLETVAAYILTHIKDYAQKHVGTDVTRAVVTVPAYFVETQRDAVRKAGKMAGLQVERILSEPTAAAVAYGYGRGLDKTILVYDFGGGTFDATVLRVDNDNMEVLATDGDAFLGGCDLDDRLTEYVLMRIERVHGVSIRTDPVAVQRIRFEVERAKCALSTANTVKIELPYLGKTDKGPLNVSIPLARDMLHTLTEDLIERTLNIVQRVLDTAKLKSVDLDDVIMVGGQSRAPMIREMLERRFARAPTRNVHPDHAIAIGAAIVGRAMSSDAPLSLTDVLPASVRVGRKNGSSEVVFTRGSTLPLEAEVQIETVQDREGTEFRLHLYSGEADDALSNQLVGEIRMPSTLALAFSKTTAPVTLKVDEEGMLSVSTIHPMTKAPYTLEISLNENELMDDDDILEIDDLDVVAL